MNDPDPVTAIYWGMLLWLNVYAPYFRWLQRPTRPVPVFDNMACLYTWQAVMNTSRPMGPGDISLATLTELN